MPLVQNRRRFSTDRRRWPLALRLMPTRRGELCCGGRPLLLRPGLLSFFALHLFQPLLRRQGRRRRRLRRRRCVMGPQPREGGMRRGALLLLFHCGSLLHKKQRLQAAEVQAAALRATARGGACRRGRLLPECARAAAEQLPHWHCPRRRFAALAAGGGAHLRHGAQAGQPTAAPPPAARLQRGARAGLRTSRGHAGPLPGLAHWPWWPSGRTAVSLEFPSKFPCKKRAF